MDIEILAHQIFGNAFVRWDTLEQSKVKLTYSESVKNTPYNYVEIILNKHPTLEQVKKFEKWIGLSYTNEEQDRSGYIYCFGDSID